MKRIKGILLLSLVMLLISVSARAGNNVIFEMEDSIGDEYGPGTYLYPKSEQFEPYQGLFDLTYFRVEEEDNNYNFYFKFVEVTNPWHAKYGFSHQLIQVYIDNQDGGRTDTFKPGANVQFEERHPWNKLIKITGWSLEIFDYRADPEIDGRIEEGNIEVLDDNQTIKVTIPQQKLGDLEKAHYYVLVGSLDGFGYDNYREVQEEATGWKFGGGTNTELNPNVLDILVPEGMEQKEILGSFDLEKKQLATIKAVGPSLDLHFKLIIIFGFIILLLLSLIGAVIKFLLNKVAERSS
ncbi:glucodextranase DOMON-like domain-containing protein [Natroniella sp. ANB-PHB2]|uniref:glucodextranase DOMON-like domain-containing protein n=1 Tax=Natroniella sp. ANB-PHB2 TaxID=3384444 RepID=UPI0038D39290